MEKQFTASEVRNEASNHWRLSDGPQQTLAGKMLHAYADLLEVRERAAPCDAERFNSLLTGTTPSGVPYGLHGSKESVETVSDMLVDAERLAEALRKIVEWQPPYVISSNGGRSSMQAEFGSNGVRDYFRRIAEEALAAHCDQAQPRETMTPRELAKRIERGENWKMVEEPSQAQPPAARVSDEMVERARSAFVKADDGSTGITEAIRAALLAAQETKA